MPMLAVATIEPWLHSSPGGGFVSTDWTPANQLEPGHVVRLQGGWVPIASIENRLGAGLVVTLADTEGTRLWLCGNGLEVRQDMRWDPVPIATCGCWTTEDGSWMCDEHLRQRKAMPA